MQVSFCYRAFVIYETHVLRGSLANMCIAGRLPKVHNLDYFNYKYLMAVDGSVGAARIPKLLSSGSLLFKAGLFSDWYSDWLIPEEHYLHVDLGYNNLKERLKWALKHDEEAKAIGKRAQEFSLKRLRKDDMRCYMYRLLLEYAAILE